MLTLSSLVYFQANLALGVNTLMMNSWKRLKLGLQETWPVQTSNTQRRSKDTKLDGPIARLVACFARRCRVPMGYI